MSRPLAGLLILAWLMLLLNGCASTGAGDYAINVYTRSDACGAAETWANYLGSYHQQDLKGTAVYGDPGLAEAVKRDPQGIGYNNLNYAYDMTTGEQISGLRVIPIDLNENGRLDVEEDFYASKTELIQAIDAHLYPSPPARDLYLVTREQFTGIAKEFVRWILTEGQKYTNEVGYISLSNEKVENELIKLGDADQETKFEGKVTISGAWALYPMMVRWTEEFQKVYPDVRFDVSAGGAGKGMTDALNGMVDIGMVSREIYPVEVDQGAFPISVTKDAVVPVVNTENPVLAELLTKGVERQLFIDIWIAGNVTDWNDVIK